MKYELEEKDLNEIYEGFKELEDRLTDMISDLHQVKGGVQARHSFMYYRKLLYGVRKKLTETCNLIQNEKLP